MSTLCIRMFNVPINVLQKYIFMDIIITYHRVVGATGTRGVLCHMSRHWQNVLDWN